jgi:hypothetical protein
MTAIIQTGLEGVTVESVETLYAEHTRMDVPDYYKDGEENPYAGRVRVIPRKAAVYAMVPERDEDRLAMARLVLKGMAKRKRVREVVCEKHELNYNQFASVGRIVVLYV